MIARYAIYFTPPADSPLTKAAAAWLGRDAFTNLPVQRPANASLSLGEIAYHTAAARRYGFHATLKAPFRLAEGESEAALAQVLADFCAKTDPVVIPRLGIGEIDGFFALVLETSSPALSRLAGDVVAAFERFRAPSTEAEIERRNPDSLDAAGLRNLCRWGYPYVFDQFRFHMTLTGRVAAHEAKKVASALQEHFSAALPSPISIASLALFVEPEPGAPFQIRAFHSLGRTHQRKSA